MSNCLKETPTCVPSHATVVGLFPQNGSVYLRKSISSAADQRKKHFSKVPTERKVEASGLYFLYSLFM